MRWRKAGRQCLGQPVRRAVLQVMQQLFVETVGKAIEQFTHIGIASTRRRFGTTTGRQHMRRHCVARLKRQPVAIHRLRLRLLAQQVEPGAQRLAGVQVVRCQRAGLLQALHRLLQMLGGLRVVAQEQAEQVMRMRGLWIGVQQGRIGDEGFFAAPLRFQYRCQIRQCIGMRRRQRQRAAIAAFGIAQAAAFAVHVAQVVAGIRLRGRQRQRLGDGGHRCGAVAALMQQDALVMQRVGMPGLIVQQLRVQLRGMFESATAVRGDRLLQCLGVWLGRSLHELLQRHGNRWCGYEPERGAARRHACNAQPTPRPWC